LIGRQTWLADGLATGFQAHLDKLADTAVFAPKDAMVWPGLRRDLSSLQVVLSTKEGPDKLGALTNIAARYGLIRHIPSREKDLIRNQNLKVSPQVIYDIALLRAEREEGDMPQVEDRSLFA
jgi:hypothetical protein